MSEELGLESVLPAPYSPHPSRLWGSWWSPFLILKGAHKSCRVAINFSRLHPALVARDRLVLGCRGSSFLLGVGRPPGASRSPAWLEDNLARLGSWKMPEFLQWRASEIQHLLWGCCHQTQTDTLAPGRGWWGPLRGQGAECSAGGGVQKALPGRGGKRVEALASARLLSLLEGFA